MKRTCLVIMVMSVLLMGCGNALSFRLKEVTQPKVNGIDIRVQPFKRVYPAEPKFVPQSAPFLPKKQKKENHRPSMSKKVQLAGNLHSGGR